MLLWFRQDLRLTNNPAYQHALAHSQATGQPITPVYILDTTARPLGGASKWFLHHAIASLQQSLPVMVYTGNPLTLIPQLMAEAGTTHLTYNRCYDPHSVTRDTALKELLTHQGCTVTSFNGSLLFEPWDIRTDSGTPYTVFTPFWKKCLTKGLPSPHGPTNPASAPQNATQSHAGAPRKSSHAAITSANAPKKSLQINLPLPTKPNWASTWLTHWTPSEQGAEKALNNFIEHGLNGYATLRDRPDLPHTSRLSPHLHHGTLSPHQIVNQIQKLKPSPNTDKFLSELGWREFSHHLLYHNPTLPTANFKKEFNHFPWSRNDKFLHAWQRGQTGYPFIDSGLRELWATGYMHNRVRMVVASFLIKHLNIHWLSGEEWFWDTLVDADIAQNAASWQWVAGSGADAAPFFRIFNPINQGVKFDPDGTYTRTWCPELAKLPTQYLHAPWQAPAETLTQAHVILGKTYPKPIIDHPQAREKALQAYQSLKNG